MKIPQRHCRCPLSRLKPVSADLAAIKQSGWREQHILVVSADDARLDWMERELLERIGERLHGEKGVRHD